MSHTTYNLKLIQKVYDNSALTALAQSMKGSKKVKMKSLSIAVREHKISIDLAAKLMNVINIDFDPNIMEIRELRKRVESLVK